MDAFLNSINTTESFTPDGLAAFIAGWEHWSVPKDHYLVKENTLADHLFFINKGIARIYYYKNGKEITEWLAMDESFFFSIISFFERTPSRLIIQTIEPAEVMGIRHDTLMSLCDQYQDIERWFRKSITASLMMSQYRMDSIQFESAQQRYEKLLSNNPGIIQRVPLSYIASWLGITPETLSRIRSTI